MVMSELGDAARRLMVLLACLAGVVVSACGGAGEPASAGDGSAFRVRSDFTAPLNADAGWAGGLNEHVTVAADQPFRLRFEVERTSGPAGDGGFQLQVRRNEGEWTPLEAHDFPLPERAHRVEFVDAAPGATPEGWEVVQGDVAAFVVAADGTTQVLRGQPGDTLVALYPPPWDLEEFSFATVFRLPANNSGGFSLVFGYQDAANHGSVTFDPSAGTIRVSRVVAGAESLLAEEAAALEAGRWLEVEIGLEGDELEVNFEDDTLEFVADVGTGMPSTPLGVRMPAGSRVDFQEFLVEGEPSTPRVSIVATPAFAHGEATTDLLGGSGTAFQGGAGISFAESTTPWEASDGHGEFEWPVVIRRYADAAETNNEGDTFSFRMVDAAGEPVPGGPEPTVTLTIPPGHLGGTFVETPGRIGPWQTSNGDLYFIMEPTESNNLFMMVKSSDGGRTWQEMDGANRPATGDLESVDGRMVDGTVHIIHQITESNRYHSFRTSDHSTNPDTWDARDEVAANATALSQMATLVVRSDGSMVTFYVGETIHYAVRSSEGTWGPQVIMDEGQAPRSAGPQAVVGADDVIHLAYYGMDGTIWYRRMMPDGTLTERQNLASGAGVTEAEFGSVLPLVYNPGSDTVVIVYRLDDGQLWERRIAGDAPPTPAVAVTDRRVVVDAVDAQQPAADVVLDGETLHVLFIDEETRSIYGTHDRGGWQPSTLHVDGILGSWVRGNVYTRPDGVRVYGYVYDAGSFGGAGMNRFGEIELESP